MVSSLRYLISFLLFFYLMAQTSKACCRYQRHYWAVLHQCSGASPSPQPFPTPLNSFFPLIAPLPMIPENLVLTNKLIIILCGSLQWPVQPHKWGHPWTGQFVHPCLFWFNTVVCMYMSVMAATCFLWVVRLQTFHCMG